MAAAPSPETIKDVNTRYHDVAAADYDVKWGISYEDKGRQQVVGKIRKALGESLDSYERALEIGAGTGYFSLNLLRAGMIDHAVATDISQGMLDALAASAARRCSARSRSCSVRGRGRSRARSRSAPGPATSRST